MNRQERLERTASMANNKGLMNNPGENNCFLNSAVQVLWHLDVFRRSFREIRGHYCIGQSCIFCALDFIFKQFQYSSHDALPPDGLRVALAVAFKNQHRFQLGDMDDAAECFENILAHMHFLLAKNEHDDACTAKHCISHQKFAMQIIEQTICECGEQSEPLPFYQLVHYVSASALCNKARSLKRWDQSKPVEDQFGVLLRRAGQDTRECPSPDCKKKVQVQRLLLNCPDIVSVGLIWDSESPDAEHIADVLECIGTTFKLSDLYHQVCDESAKDASLQLVGIVTYYGKHYSTFFFHSKLRSWIYFDDARVKEIGSQWGTMMEKCRRCHYQPLLLLFANPNGTPVNAESAPKKKIYVNGAAQRKTNEVGQSGKRLVPPKEIREVYSDGERSPKLLKKLKSRHSNGGLQDKTSSPYTSKKSLSSGDLASPHKALSRSSSNASDTAASRSGKSRHKPSFKRISNAIMHAVNPALAVGHWKPGDKKKKSAKSRRSSTGSSESSGDHDLMDLSSKDEDAKLEIMKLYEQSKAMNASQGSPVNHDSGISSVPSSAASSAAGSVSSTETNHGGSDEDLIDFSQTWRHSRYDNWPVVYENDFYEALLHEAEKYLLQSQNAENDRDYATALSYCTEANTRFRKVTEANGVNLNRKNYANIKRNCCQERARNLRQLLQSHPPSDPSFSKPHEEDQTVLQRQKDQLILRNQPRLLPPNGSISRRERVIKETSAPDVGNRRERETPLSSAQGIRPGTNYGSYPYTQGISALPSKPKIKATVYSSGHYVNGGHMDKRISSGMIPQQIKPDAMCYSPVHHDRDSEIAARIRNLNFGASAPNQAQTTVITVGDTRPKVYESNHSRPPPPPRRVSGATMYISPSSEDSRTPRSASYEPTVYSSSASQSSVGAATSRSRPKVFYQGNSTANSVASVRDRSPSPARSMDGLESVHAYQVTAPRAPKTHDRRPPQYVPAPPYNALHQREYLKSRSTSSLSEPWYQSSDEEPFGSNAHDLRQVSKRIIADRPVCERCQWVPIERRQRLCAGCENELHQKHSNIASTYWGQ